jgi:hypothetical protein
MYECMTFIFRIKRVTDKFYQQGNLHSSAGLLVVVALCGSIFAISSAQGYGEEGIGHCLFGNTVGVVDCPGCHQGHWSHLVWCVVV